MIKKELNWYRFASVVMIVFLIVPIIFNAPTTMVGLVEQESDLKTSGTTSYVVVPLTINVVQGTSISKEKIEANIKKMNEIYNSEVVIFVWDGTINTIPDPSTPGGTSDGDVTSLEDRTKVRNQAEENAKSKGVSITVCSDLGDNTNGITIVGGAHSAMVVNSTEGDTWAHEVQHSLGQSHGDAKPADEDLDGDGDPSNDEGWDINGDGQVTRADQEYNLWGRKSDRTGDKINCGAIFNASKDLPGARVKTRPQTAVAMPPPTTQAGSATDNRSDTVNQTGSPKPAVTWVDIIRGGLIKNYSVGTVKLWMEIASTPLENCTYIFAFDYLESSGNNDTFGLLGADLIVTFSTAYGGQWTHLFEWENNTGEWIPPDGDFLGIFDNFGADETINYDNSTGSGWVESFFDVWLSIVTPHPLLFSITEGSFNMWMTASWMDLDTSELMWDVSEKAGVTLLNTVAETITVKNETVNKAQVMTVNGTAFSPNSKVTIYVDGVNVSTVITDPSGRFSKNITVPNTPKNNSILMARDEQGKTDAIYINIKDVPGGGQAIPFMLLPVVLLALTFALSLKLNRKFSLI
ncbi:MAG: hypothetical protein EU536_05005 [Promethearchaeota archaeon]|nr:MAG: hypothetical protein EU536_05005 [Candidatus Lokiarchaeota archaeon]